MKPNNKYPGVDATVAKSLHPQCDRCHKRLEFLFSLQTANFGAIKCCIRCTQALKDDSYISELEYLEGIKAK